MSRAKSDKFRTLGESIRSARKRCGFSQVELSDKIGVTSKTIGLIERGRVAANAGTLRLIAQGLGLPADYFLESDAKRETVTHRLVFELDLPEGLDLSDEDVKMVRGKVLSFGHDLLKIIKDLRK